MTNDEWQKFDIIVQCDLNVIQNYRTISIGDWREPFFRSFLVRPHFFSKDYAKINAFD